MATYRAHIEGSEAAANGDVHFTCKIQRLDAGEWVDVHNGSRTLVMDGAAALVITEGEGTANEKRAALGELFRQTALGWGIDEADDANEQINALVSFPVDVNLEI